MEVFLPIAILGGFYIYTNRGKKENFKSNKRYLKSPNKYLQN